MMLPFSNAVVPTVDICRAAACVIELPAEIEGEDPDGEDGPELRCVVPRSGAHNHRL